jgi:O-antigen/teichoic acid export membrane protein
MSLPFEVPNLAPLGNQSPRHRRVFSALGTAILGRGSVLVVNAVSIPIVVRYLGAEQYGLWVTISTTVAMLVYFDIGIASTLTNLISETYAADDPELAGQYFATAFWASVVVAVGLAVLSFLLWRDIDFGALMRIQDSQLISEVSKSVLVAGALFLCNLPLGLGAKALAGYQKLHIANLFSGAGNLGALAAIVTVVAFKGSLVTLIASYTAAITFANLVCLLWVVLFQCPWLLPLPAKVRLSALKRVFSSGGQFFLIQIAGLIVFNSDNIVIAHFMNPSAVTPYNVTWKLVTYANALQVLLSQALWPAYSEAWASRHFEWIRTTYVRVRWITFASLAAACAILIPFGREIIKIWAGAAAVPSSSLLLLMCVWMIIFAITTNQACLMGATGRIGKQAISSSLAAIVNVSLSIYWAKSLGTFGVLLATVVSYVLFIFAVQSFEVRGILKFSGALLDGSQTA